MLKKADVSNIKSAKFKNIQFLNIIKIILIKSKVIIIMTIIINIENSKS